MQTSFRWLLDLAWSAMMAQKKIMLWVATPMDLNLYPKLYQRLDGKTKLNKQLLME